MSRSARKTPFRRIVPTLIAAVLLAAAPALARQVTVAWDPNPAGENVTGYRVNYGTTSKRVAGFTGYDTVRDAGNVTQYTVTLPDDAVVYYLAVVAYNGAGLTSDYSDEVSTDAPVGNSIVATVTGGGGTITPSGTVAVAAGTDQTFTLAADVGHHLSELWVDGVSAGTPASYTFTAVAADHIIDAAFAADLFTLDLSADSGGQVTPSGTVTASYGEAVTVTVVPDPGHHVTDVVVDGVSQGAVSTYSFPGVQANHTLAASFGLDSYTVSTVAGSNGSVSPPGATSVPLGGNLTVSVTPDVGYHTVDVVVDGGSVGAVGSYTFTNVTAGHTLAASFAVDTYTVTATAGTGGTVSPSGPVSVAHGASRTFTVAPDLGYRVVDVQVDGASVGAVTTYSLDNVTADHTLTATFAVATYDVTVSVGPGGACSPSGAVSVDHGSDLVLQCTPEVGNQVVSITVDGTDGGSSNPFTLFQVVAPHSVSVSFGPVPPTAPAGVQLVSVVNAGGT